MVKVGRFWYLGGVTGLYIYGKPEGVLLPPDVAVVLSTLVFMVRPLEEVLPSDVKAQVGWHVSPKSLGGVADG